MLKLVVENKTDIGGNNTGFNAEAVFQDHQYCLYDLHHGQHKRYYVELKVILIPVLF